MSIFTDSVENDFDVLYITPDSMEESVLIHALSQKEKGLSVTIIPDDTGGVHHLEIREK